VSRVLPHDEQDPGRRRRIVVTASKADTLRGRWARAGRLVLACGAVCASMSGTAAGQTAAANSGALTFTGGVDFPSEYVYRGIIQEGDPQLTLTPFGDLGIRLSGDADRPGGTHINIGIWNSLHTGTSGSGGPLKGVHYSEQFYVSMTFGLGSVLSLTPGYTADSSPNGGYNTIKEFTLRVDVSRPLAPYAQLAFELDDAGQMDAGSKKGSYLEIGVTPSFGLGFWGAQLMVPVKAGFSLGNYYELFEDNLTYQDHPFGFVEVGGHVSVPLSSSTSRFGAWDAHGGVELYSFGETTRAFNMDERSKIVVVGGVGVKY
jgi:hypothetical protein